MSDAHGHDHHDVHHAGEFDQEIDVRTIAKSLVWLTVLIAVSMLLMWWLSVALKKREMAMDPPASPIEKANETMIPPEPRLQASPPVELSTVRAEEHQLLTTYGWAGAPGTVARIPVSRAMEIVAQRGLPRPPLVQPVTLPPAVPVAEAGSAAPSH